MAKSRSVQAAKAEVSGIRRSPRDQECSSRISRRLKNQKRPEIDRQAVNHRAFFALRDGRQNLAGFRHLNVPRNRAKFRDPHELAFALSLSRSATKCFRNSRQHAHDSPTRVTRGSCSIQRPVGRSVCILDTLSAHSPSLGRRHHAIAMRNVQRCHANLPT